MCVCTGDERVNEQPGLAAIHTLFHFEHNRLVRELTEAYLYRIGYPFSPQDIEYFLQVAPAHLQERIHQVRSRSRLRYVKVTMRVKGCGSHVVVDPWL
jgi:hypothetical protein